MCQYSTNSLLYATSFVPLLILETVLLILVFLTIFFLSFDLLQYGCVAWHRDSLGYLTQALVCIICLLVTTMKLMNYIKALETGQRVYVENDHQLLTCFVPMLILSSLWLLKLVCFNVKNSIMHLAIAMSVISMAFACESKFDNDIENAPLFIVAIPCSCILLAISFQQLLEIYFEPDECVALFNSYDSKFKRILAIFNAVITFAFVVSSILALYFLEQKYTNNEDDKQIVQWVLFSTLCYAALMMEQSGSLVLSLVFN